MSTPNTNNFAQPLLDPVYFLLVKEEFVKRKYPFRSDAPYEKPGTVDFRRIHAIVRRLGCYKKRCLASSHVHYAHPKCEGIITVAGQGKQDVRDGTLGSILEKTNKVLGLNLSLSEFLSIC